MRSPLAALLFLGVSAVSATVLLSLPSSAGPLSPMTDGGKDSGVISKIPPDPTPMNERLQWVFDLRWDKGDVYLLDTHKQDMNGPHPTPRAMGRFALELFEGPTLIERVRFDFPLLGAPEDAGSPIKFETKLKTRIGVFFPATKRGTRLELWDRARDIRWQLPWPPSEGPQNGTQKSSDASLD